MRDITASLALVRHGESTWIAEGRFQGRADPPLSPAGLRQAAAVGRRLADPGAAPSVPLPDGPPVAIWHSPLARAASTAAAIADARGDAQLRPDPDLAELAQGDWEGLTQGEVRSRYATELEAWRRDPVANHAPGGESLDTAAARALRAVDRTLTALTAATPPSVEESASAEAVLGYRHGAGVSSPDGSPWGIVVAHDGILRLIVLQLLGIPIGRYWSLPFGLCAVTVVELRDGVARLRAHNLEEHHQRD